MPVIQAGFAVLFATAVVSGVGFAVLPRVDRPDSETDRIPLVIATGLAITIGTLVLLSLFSALHPLLLAGLLAVVVAVLGLRLLTHVRQLASERASRDVPRAAVLAAAFAVIRAVAVPAVLVSGIVVLQFVMTAGYRAPGGGFAPWYYWGSSLQVAAAAGYPASVEEWGITVPFLGDYLPFNSAAAGFSFILDGRLIAEMQAFRAVVLIVAVSGAFYALRRFFPTMLAAFGVVLLFSSSELLIKFASIRPESFGLGLAAWALWALDVGMVERRPTLLGIAAVLAALVAASHLPAFLVFTALALSMLAYRVMADRQIRAYAVRFALTGAGSLLVAAALSVAAQQLRGTTTFLGELFGNASGMVDNIDQTFLLNVSLRGVPYESPPSAAELINPRVFAPWASQLGLTPALLLVVAASLLAFIALRRMREIQPALRGAGRVGVTMLALTGVILLFVMTSATAETYVPRRTGPTRIAPYVLLAYVLLPLGIASAARWIAPPLRRVLAFIGLALVVGFVSFTSYAEARDQPAHPGPTDTQLAELRHAGAALRSVNDSRPLVLTNDYTEGRTPVLLKANGLLDGRVPYTNAPLRDHVLAVLRDTEAFFQSGDCALTEQYDPDYILFTSKRNRRGHFSGYARGPRFKQIAHVVEPVFAGRSLRVFGYQEFCAAAEKTP